MLRGKLTAIVICLLVLLATPIPVLAAESGYKLLTDYKYDSIYQTAGNLIIAYVKGRTGAETLDGKTILPFAFEDIEIVCAEDGETLGLVAAVRKGGALRYELYDVSGRRLLEKPYDYAWVNGEYVVLGNGVENERLDGLYDLRAKTMITSLSPGRISSSPGGRIFSRAMTDSNLRSHSIFYDGSGEIRFSNLPDDLEIVSHLGQGYFQTNRRGTQKYGVCTIDAELLPAEYEAALLGDINFLLLKDGLWGTADKQGNISVDFTFPECIPGYGLFYKAGEDGKAFYTETGRYLAAAGDFRGRQGNTYYFEKGGKIGGIRADGEAVIPFFYDGIGVPPHPYKGFTILYNESPNYNPRLDNRYDFTAVNSEGEIIIPRGRYAYLSSTGPEIVIDCYDENMKVVAQYTRDGQKIPLVVPMPETHAGLITLTSDLYIRGISNRPWRFNEPNRYAAWKNGKYALLELQSDFGKPSAWAEKELQSARALELIPYELDIAYKSACTREEFCIYLARTLEKINGKNLETLVQGYGELKTFPDCPRYEVSVAYTLGIVSGMSETTFAPEARITREQAAAILSRTAAFLEIESNGNALTFTDSDTFSDYAKEDIAFISSVIGNGARVMTGVGSDRFNPRGLYTREQAILTLLRLYQSKADAG